MKKHIFYSASAFIILFLFSTTAFSQDATTGTGQVEVSQGTIKPWVEMDAFQALLNSTFSAAEKGDLAPIRKDSDQLTKLSISMAKSAMPAVHDNVEMRTQLGELTDRCEEFSQFVKGKNSDAEIIEQFTKLNSTYQEILALKNTQLTEKK
ncbi:MAG: hypothetical protein KA444_02075 [Bacteroidia bacterium]|nr:hypothetical protein [Bacteroidia bacterium]